MVYHIVYIIIIYPFFLEIYIPIYYMFLYSGIIVLFCVFCSLY